jgi:hypothetical protein
MPNAGAQVNGAAKPNPGGGELLSGPSAQAQAQARIRAGRADTLAALQGGNLAAPPAKPPAPKAEVEKPAPELEAKPDVADVEDAADAADAGGEVKADEVAKDPAVDAETAKRLDSIAKAEKRSRDKIAADRAALKAEAEKHTAEMKPRLEALDKFEQAKKIVHKDPQAALELLGLGDDAALEAFARAAFAMTEAGKKDPAGAKANAELAARTLREREANTQTSALQKRLDELEQKLTQKDQQAQFESKRTAYIEHAAKQITDETPIAKALGEKNPEKLRAALWATTERLVEENDGEVPDPADVLATYEKTRRAELEELGVDPTTLATPKKNTQTADKKHPAKTLGNDLSTPRVPRPARSDREHRAETLEMLESGRLE